MPDLISSIALVCLSTCGCAISSGIPAFLQRSLKTTKKLFLLSLNTFPSMAGKIFTILKYSEMSLSGIGTSLCCPFFFCIRFKVISLTVEFLKSISLVSLILRTSDILAPVYLRNKNTSQYLTLTIPLFSLNHF